MTIVSDVTSVVNGDDEEFQKYKCPVLFGQVVTVFRVGQRGEAWGETARRERR